MNSENTIEVLKKELEFVRRGGYRVPLVWRAPLVFEDSSICPKDRCSACPHADCVLMSFVPRECQNEAVPCRHIPLNETGETLDSLYTTATNDEIEQALQGWLIGTLRQLEEAFEQPWLEKAA